MKNKINRPEDSTGQNPLWPGDGNKNAGKYVNKKTGEEIVIPFVDSLPHKKNTKT